VTLAGRCHAHNVGVSLITTVGLSEHWVAHSEDEYVTLALRAASDLEVSLAYLSMHIMKLSLPPI